MSQVLKLNFYLSHSLFKVLLISIKITDKLLLLEKRKCKKN